MKNIILASASPRRRELLEMVGIPFSVFPADVDETLDNHLTPEENVMKLADRKAQYVAKDHASDIIIGSDTLVVVGQIILGKPVDKNDALNMLKLLSGKTHQVITGVSIINNEQCDTFYSKTKVTFYSLTETEMLEYIATNEPFDKAGAYAIQGMGAKFIESIAGDYYTVVGLPIGQLYQKLKNFIHS